MGLLEKMQQENIEQGIVPRAAVQNSKYLRCEECSIQIDPMEEGSTRRYDSRGQAIYKHVECPADEWETEEVSM